VSFRDAVVQRRAAATCWVAMAALMTLLVQGCSYNRSGDGSGFGLEVCGTSLQDAPGHALWYQLPDAPVHQIPGGFAILMAVPMTDCSTGVHLAISPATGWTILRTATATGGGTVGVSMCFTRKQDVTFIGTSAGKVSFRTVVRVMSLSQDKCTVAGNVSAD
jgi:hypothetical protein